MTDGILQLIDEAMGLGIDFDLYVDAHDPSSSPERLLEILAFAQDLQRQGLGGLPAAGYLRATVLRNPSCPLPLLRSALCSTSALTDIDALRAWFNPIVPTLLLAEPSPVYLEGARSLLARLSPQRGPDGSLESLVEGWSRHGASSWAERPTTAQAIALARHLAVLFSLPWPEESAEPSSPTSE